MSKKKCYKKKWKKVGKNFWKIKKNVKHVKMLENWKMWTIIKHVKNVKKCEKL